jgi:hypothetical protein
MSAKEKLEKAIEELETPDFRLATDERRRLEKMEGTDAYQMMKLWFHELVRCSDPKGCYDPNVGLTATKFKMGLYPQESKAELVDLILSGEYPEDFLSQVRSLIRDQPEISQESAYLNSLKVFYLSNGRWPCISELDRQAVDDHPEVFHSIQIKDGKSLSPDERRMFRRIRKRLGIDWLPQGKTGPKN